LIEDEGSHKEAQRAGLSSRADGIRQEHAGASRGGTGERRGGRSQRPGREALNLAITARALRPEFNITLEHDFAPALAPIELVPQDVTRVLLTLWQRLLRATKRRRDGASPIYGGIEGNTYDCGEAVEIRVRDNGTGIPPEN